MRRVCVVYRWAPSCTYNPSLLDIPSNTSNYSEIREYNLFVRLIAFKIHRLSGTPSEKFCSILIIFDLFTNIIIIFNHM